MRASFPTAFHGVLLGKSREAGSFRADDDREVNYGDAYEVSFESSEGLTQTVRVTGEAIRDACGKDPASLSKFQQLAIKGDVIVNDSRVSFKPTEIQLPKPS